LGIRNGLVVDTKTQDLSWEQFIADCARAYDGGLSEREFGARLVGKSVRWKGSIYELHLREEKLVPGLKIDMPRYEVPLGNGFLFVGSDLFLELHSGAAVSATRRLRKGHCIEFVGTFRDQGVFASVRFTPDEEQNKVFLSLGLTGGSLL
jgi:hypothetical protein